MQVSDVTAAGLRDQTDASIEEGRAYDLVLGFERFGRGVFLNRPALAVDVKLTSRTQSRDQVQIVKELGLYLKSLPAPPAKGP